LLWLRCPLEARGSGQFMKSIHDHLQRADRLIWALIAIVAATDLAASVGGPFHIKWASFQAAGIVSLLFYAAGSFYSTRNDLRAASALLCTAQFMLFAAVGAPLSYIGASAARPLWDSIFASWDRGLGLDWMAWLAIMNDHPAFHPIFAAAYSSFLPQAAIVILALALTGSLLRLRVYILSFILTTVVTVAISAALPAEGVWGHFQLSPSDYPAITPVTQELHLKVFHGLRDGTFHDLVAQGAEGIITFPSLHTTGALLFIFAMWSVRYLRWLAMLLNITMIVATPVEGGHYFSDMIAGTCVAALCWIAASRIVGARAKRHDVAELIHDLPSIVPDGLPEGVVPPLSRKFESV
jgi:membrane-associated phospholipid phosphatase